MLRLSLLAFFLFGSLFCLYGTRPPVDNPNDNSYKGNYSEGSRRYNDARLTITLLDSQDATNQQDGYRNEYSVDFPSTDKYEANGYQEYSNSVADRCRYWQYRSIGQRIKSISIQNKRSKYK